MQQVVGSPRDEEKPEMKFSLGRSFLRAPTAAVAGDPGQGATNSKGFLIFQSMKKSPKVFHCLKEMCRGNLVKIPCRSYSHDYL